MKNGSKKIIASLSLIFSSAALANCYVIQDSDSKNYCLAKSKNQSSYCYVINYSDMKNNCLAQLKSQRNYCYNIRSNDLKSECLALVKN
jgi:hypothetical protein